MSKLPAIFVLPFLALAAFASCSSPASSNPVSEDGFVSIPGGTHTVDCDEQGNGCREVTVETFEIDQYPVKINEWNQCHFGDGYCQKPFGGSGQELRPVSNISIFEILQEFLPWKMFREQRLERSRYVYDLPTIDEYLVAVDTRSNVFCSTPSELKFEWSRYGDNRKDEFYSDTQVVIYDFCQKTKRNSNVMEVKSDYTGSTTGFRLIRRVRDN